MALRIRSIAPAVLIAGCLVGGLAAQTRYVPDKVGKWTLERHDYMPAKVQATLSPAEKSRFDVKISGLISAIQQSKIFSPPMGIEPHVYANYEGFDEPDLCANQPCVHHPPAFALNIQLWYYMLLENGQVGLQKFTSYEAWVHVNNLTETLGDMPWAERIRLPDGRQIRYRLHETTARVAGFPVYEHRSGDMKLVLTKRNRAPWVPVTREQLVLALIRERERLNAPLAAAMKSAPPSCAAAYNEWISHQDERRKTTEEVYQVTKKTDSAGAERYRADMEKLAADMTAQLKAGQARCEAQRKQAAQQAPEQVSPDRTVKPLRAELARMSPAERTSPAWYDKESKGPTLLGWWRPARRVRRSW
ncbi:MAG: hypothetical protein ABSC77_11680 [Terracidiphilus sp.]|jgi:hypothetical protein